MKIAVGGMIAAGKSTIVKKLGEYYNLPIMEEYEKDDEVFNTMLNWLYTGKDNVEMLLQIYFLHTHWQNQKKYNGNFIVDRDLIEHWIFAQINLENKYQEVMNMYNGIFYTYMNTITKPDMYVILDVTWEDFVKRIHQRGRPSEVDNFEANKEYFKNLLKDYKKKLKAQCITHNIPYIVIMTEDRTVEEVFDAVVNVLDHELVRNGLK